MKTTLKGRGRYYPGCMYGMIFALPISMLFFYIIFKITGFDGFSDGAALAFLGVFLVLYFIGTWLGKKFFDFTERMFSNNARLCSHAHVFAVITEFVMFFLTLGAFFGISLLLLQLASGNPPPEKINGWD